MANYKKSIANSEEKTIFVSCETLSVWFVVKNVPLQRVGKRGRNVLIVVKKRNRLNGFDWLPVSRSCFFSKRDRTGSNYSSRKDGS